jgi:GrpB-like predicted nucleotidyltransferase (UPF0157 family)
MMLVESISLRAAGLGLEYGSVRLVRARASWTQVGAELAADVASTLPECVVAVEHVGSTAVPDLLAKPIIDLAIGVQSGTRVEALIEPMQAAGWIYRGDAGEDGGWVFVLEDEPWHRVAHAHGVEHDGFAWQRYLALRALLRSSADARRAYEDTKLRLAEEYGSDARRYTAGKTETVEGLLAR